MTEVPAISIEVAGLSKKLRETQALRDITLKFESGVMHGIIGPEGAGKTTLLRHLVGLLHANQGEVCYFQNGQKAPFAHIRDHIAYMPQQQSLYADLSISEHLNFFRELYAIEHQDYQKRREELLHITQLTRFVDRPAGKLSGGMYKKLGLICALLRSPWAVLLDEPTNGVDPISRQEFWELLTAFNQRGVLILITTAYMDEAERCSKAHVLDNGRVIAQGSPKEILQKEGVEGFGALFIKYESA
ncbi:MAG: ABC transporter ATP-binding protein [Myxococcota bacterium]